jgi:hypothetical protein
MLIFFSQDINLFTQKIIPHNHPFRGLYFFLIHILLNFTLNLIFLKIIQFKAFYLLNLIVLVKVKDFHILVNIKLLVYSKKMCSINQSELTFIIFMGYFFIFYLIFFAFWEILYILYLLCFLTFFFFFFFFFFSLFFKNKFIFFIFFFFL